jgi:preprotein translocase subunit SecG
VSYRALDADHIIKTLQLLERRIVERFPGSSLGAVCRDLTALAVEVQERSRAIAAPNLLARGALIVAIAAGIVGLVLVVRTVKVQMGEAEIFSVFQGVEAAMNIVVLVGAALFFLISLETRLKRRRSLGDLHAFRSIAHVIDMHQLTKDPSFVIAGADATASSPKRAMSRFELTRYLDYCSEMLSLTNKLAALYAQHLPDPVIIDAVNDIEQLTTNLSSKIWQKITILDTSRPAG